MATEAGSVARSNESGPSTTASGQGRSASASPIAVDGREATCFSLADRIATRGRSRWSTAWATSTALRMRPTIRPKWQTVVTPASVRTMGRPRAMGPASKTVARLTVGRTASASMWRLSVGVGMLPLSSTSTPPARMSLTVAAAIWSSVPAGTMSSGGM